MLSSLKSILLCKNSAIYVLFNFFKNLSVSGCIISKIFSFIFISFLNFCIVFSIIFILSFFCSINFFLYDKYSSFFVLINSVSDIISFLSFINLLFSFWIFSNFILIFDCLSSVFLKISGKLSYESRLRCSTNLSKVSLIFIQFFEYLWIFSFFSWLTLLHFSSISSKIGVLSPIFSFSYFSSSF